MPKMKTNKSVAKRMKKTATGKFKRNKTRRRHLLTCKNRKQKRSFKEQPLVENNDSKRLSVLIPYA
ncbi:50S ribosomal protein L35 [bacterium B13(2017)]|nr:50S ribosomal protein L35 [bacterium B13(2017)]